VAYARFGEDSDVYVFPNPQGRLECCDCDLGGVREFDSTQAMIDHLAEHRAAGHKVPDYIEPELIAENDETFPTRR